MRRHSRFPLIAVVIAMLSALKGQPVPEKDAYFTVPTSIARVISPEYRSLLNRRQQLESKLLDLPGAPNNERAARVGWKVFGYDNALHPEQWIDIDLGSIQTIDSVCLVPIDLPASNSNAPGMGFPRRFRLELVNPASGRTMVVDRADRDFPNPGPYPVLIPTPGAIARRVRVVMNKPWTKARYRGYALGEVMILQGNRNLVTGLTNVTVKTSESFEHRPAWSRQNLIDGQSIAGAPIAKTDRPQTHGWQSEIFGEAMSPVWVQVDLGRSVALDEIRLLPVKYIEISTAYGYGFPSRFKVELADDVGFTTARTVADWSSRPLVDSSFSPLTIPCNGASGRFIRVTAHELAARDADHFIFALAELQAYQGDTNVALHAKVTASSATLFPRLFAPEFLTDGQRGMMGLTEWPTWLDKLSQRREAEFELGNIKRRIEEIQPRLARMVSQTAAVSAAIVALAILGSFLHLRRKQARAVAALQRRIAGDLHDEIGSNLASIAMMAELGHREATGLRPGDIDEIRQLATDSASAMRDIVWLTQPGPHDVPQLTERLREAAQRLLKGVEWTFQIEGLKEAPALDVQRHLLLALKEMLNNVVRHSGAGQVRIRLMVEKRSFTLAVEDDGRGFSVDQRVSGHGLTSLRHRSTLLHGSLELASQPGRGTCISLSGLLCPSARTPVIPT